MPCWLLWLFVVLLLLREACPTRKKNAAMESHEAMPLQEVMSPTLGPASAIRNAGMTSGPSTTTADQVPSSSMSHGRATFDAAVGQVGSLGAAAST